MSLADGYGNTLTTRSAEARDHYESAVTLFLGANREGLAAFSHCVAADPQFALGHVGLARALMSAGRTSDAKDALKTAESLAFDVTSRERDHIAATGLVFSGQSAKARQAIRAHLSDHPRDVLLAQMCASVFGLIAFSGEAGHEASLLAFTESLLPHYGEDWWMMATHAVSLCETGQIAASEVLMARSLALNPRNANGAHFKSHALYERGETTAGRQYLTTWVQDYDDRGVLHGHLNWHLALWALHDGDEGAMWAILDGSVGPGASKGLPINILTDTVAILHRAEIAGYAVDPRRWTAASEYAAQYFPNPGQSFADLHAAIAHAMSGKGDRLARLAESSSGYAGDLLAPVSLAFGHIARGRWSDALDALVPVLPVAERFGGSRAQRDLVELAYVNVLMKLGLVEEARRTLKTRRPVLSDAPPVSGLT
ncbi:tetratricopeptide repeat protein [Silicimonas algicola]|uniref:Tetratricopeptide repeat protein 38 n=1 Tax=Silicimonas algicola TaxID=1826607 RepID=A0A316GBN8_9RHOB|nr:tetratricopeptide repeat protein [Silicimonas algicola]AZQ66045.1 tetratricopeptide repeat protein [Silicimonas algicola]PWK58341.1 Tfp pilus assembly protein PilF [Silicimonas algicola]